MNKFKLFIVIDALILLALPLAAIPSLSAPSSVRQGEPILCWLCDNQAIEGGRAELLSQAGKILDSTGIFEMPFKSPQHLKVYGFLFAAGMDAKVGAYVLAVSGRERPVSSVPISKSANGVFSLRLAIGIEARPFFAEEIRLDAANSILRTKPDPRKDAEARALLRLLGTSDEGAAFLDSGFSLPVGNPRRSAGFGDRRRYHYADGGSETSIHAGIDIACVRGTPVHACAAGRVVFAGMRIVTGYTIVVEHLPGLYSVYMHLARLDVAPGFLVRGGELLGLSGSTGLSTGPHLHWELRIRGRAVDPDYWVSASPLDKNMPTGTIVGAIEGG